MMQTESQSRSALSMRCVEKSTGFPRWESVACLGSQCEPSAKPYVVSVRVCFKPVDDAAVPPNAPYRNSEPPLIAIVWPVM